MQENVHRYHGTDIEVSFDSERCIHARECVEGLPAVFDTDRRPWVSPDGADPDELAAVIERCPTGALGYERNDGGPAESPPPRNTLTVVEDGPLYLRGDVAVRSADGETLLEDSRVALCRCGHSGNKPLCDNSHDRVFEAEGMEPEAAAVVEDESAGSGDGEPGRLTVTLTPDGPFRVAGRFTLREADAAEERDGEDALCRCGASRNKPFCDGSHAAAGFSTADEE